MRTTTPAMIGRNLRPGFRPGGFWPPMPMSTAEKATPYHVKVARHKEIVEAANRVLEKRMPSVVAETFIKEQQT